MSLKTDLSVELMKAMQQAAEEAEFDLRCNMSNGDAFFVLVGAEGKTVVAGFTNPELHEDGFSGKTKYPELMGVAREKLALMHSDMA